MNANVILRFVACVSLLFLGSHLNGGLTGLSGKRDLYRGTVERIDGKRSITIRVNPGDALKTFPTCDYTELKKDNGYVDWDYLHVGSNVTLVVLTATKATEEPSLFVDGRLTVEIQIEGRGTIRTPRIKW